MTKDSGTIRIEGGTQTGRTIVAHEIANFIAAKFGAQVFVDRERQGEFADLDWRELELIRNQRWMINS